MKPRKKYKLTDVDLDEISLVDRGAAQDAVIMLHKRDKELPMPNVLVALAKKFGLEGKDLTLTKLDTMLAALRTSMTTILKHTPEPSERDDMIRESLDQFATTVLADAAVLTPVAKADNPGTEDDIMDEEQVTALQKKFEDENAKALALLEKKFADERTAAVALLEKRLTDSETKLAASEAREQERAILTKAESLVASTGQPVTVGAVLLKAAGEDKAAQEALAGVFTALKAAQTDAGLFKSLGSGVRPITGGMGGTDAERDDAVLAKASEIRKADPKLSQAQAIKKAAFELNVSNA